MINSLSFYIFFSACFIFVLSAGAQNRYAHDWINVSSTYYKFKIAENGIYKVTFEELVESGWTHGTVPSVELKLFNFGKEQPLYVSASEFGPGSWIEFYGEKNTIGLDSILYENWKRDLLNPDYSLVNDTNAYYLTLSPGTTNIRYNQIFPNFSTHNLSALDYYMHEEKIVFSNAYFKNVDGTDVRNSFFESSEGFGSGPNNQTTQTINTSAVFTTGPAPVLSFRTGLNNVNNAIDISWNGQIIEKIQSAARRTVQFTTNLNISDIRNNNTFGLRNVFSANDRHHLAHVALTYPRNFDFQNKDVFYFSLPPSSELRFIVADNFKTDQQVWAYDLVHQHRYSTRIVDNTVEMLINPSTSSVNIVLVQSSSGMKKVPQIKTFIPREFINEGQNYLIITHKTLYSQGPDYVREYAEYRESQEGGNYSVDILDVEDIYEHFGYGIDRHFSALKNLGAFIKNEWPQVQFVFILGKGVEYPFMRTPQQVTNNVNRIFYVPTYGFTGSDNLLFSEGNFPDPPFALGRLAANDNTDIKNYLEKVIIYEAAANAPQTMPDRYWQKRVLHLGGGKNVGEQNAIQFGLNSMKDILTGPFMGAEVISYFKTNFDVIDFNTNEDITRLYNSGLHVINFFGHSSANTWEFPIDNPRSFNNFGRYPVMNSFGCYSGNLNSTGRGISESFVLEKDRGAIAFFASTGNAFISSLSNYGRRYFNLLYKDRLFSTFGETITHLARENRNTFGSELALYSQMIFHGDPALKPYLTEFPDYTFDPESVRTEPLLVSASENSFTVFIDAINLGMYNQDTVELQLTHILPSGTIADTFSLRLGDIASRRSIELSLKNYGLESIGKNTLKAIINPKQNVTEGPLPQAFANNELEINGVRGFEFFVTDNFATGIYPPDFAMINTKDHFILKASTATVPLEPTDFIFEIDTTLYFNSPVKETGRINSTGGLITYTPQMEWMADRVYYWRVSPEPRESEDLKWSTQSFACIPYEEEGWNQSHFFQFAQNEFIDLELNEDTDRKFVFGEQVFDIRMKNKFWDPEDPPGYTRNNITFGSVRPWLFMESGIAFVLLDKKNDYVRNPRGGLYGSLNPTANSIAVFPFETNSPEKRKNIMDFMNNVVQDDYSVTVFTIIKDNNSELNIQDWEGDKAIYGTDLFDTFDKMGARQFSELKTMGSVPYIFHYDKKKGQFIAVDEEIALQKDEVISTNILSGVFTKRGLAYTADIRNIPHINTVKTRIDKVAATEKAQIKVYKNQNNQRILLDSLDNVRNVVSNISVSPDENIILENIAEDSVDVTPAQLEFWRITYQSLPDAAIRYSKTVPSLDQNRARQGEKVKIHYEVINVNFVDMDSILVRYSYVDDKNVSEVRTKKLAALPAGATLTDEVEFTMGLGDITNVRLIVEINPDKNQPELHQFNNILTKQIGVVKDDDNPQLDIFFDGMRIMDGDIVSAKPEIRITLADENSLLPITDASLFEIKLDTGINQILDIPIDSPLLTFTPADANNPEASLLYRPELKEGEYRLIVQGRDMTGNKSGTQPRAVSFRVIVRQSVSQVFNYPNPFSTSTQFVFTLTGSEVPDVMTITIMTLTGKIIREITKEELGPLRIGVNRTEFKWDGTDEYGEKLANGVYLYRVNTRNNQGEKVDLFSQGYSDDFFTKGVGKMVIMR